MFGYIRPLRDELKMRDYDRYRAAYCGLCHALGKRCGFAARFLISYDMTFLYLLLHAPEPLEPTRMHHCPAHVTKRACVVQSDALDRAADYSVLLYVWKLRDEIHDESFFRRLAARFALVMLRGSYRKAARRRPEEDAQIARQLEKLAELERQHTPVLDAPADAFAVLLTCFGRQCAQKREMYQLLYHIGRYIYLVDALDDLAEDCAKGRYNPLRDRFAVENGKLSSADRQTLLATIHSSIGMACAALELLEIKSSAPLLQNVLYQGMPAVLQAVAGGTFQTQGKI